MNQIGAYTNCKEHNVVGWQCFAIITTSNIHLKSLRKIDWGCLDALILKLNIFAELVVANQCLQLSTFKDAHILTNIQCVGIYASNTRYCTREERLNQMDRVCKLELSAHTCWCIDHHNRATFHWSNKHTRPFNGGHFSPKCIPQNRFNAFMLQNIFERRGIKKYE